MTSDEDSLIFIYEMCILFILLLVNNHNFLEVLAIPLYSYSYEMKCVFIITSHLIVIYFLI